jgi:N-acetyl-gamma-glutamyl-phosphate reductase
MRKVGILGATGYTGVVLLSILLRHPQVAVTLVTSNTHRGKRLSGLFPSIGENFNGVLEPTDADHRGKCDVYFLCLPHGTSAERARDLFDGRAIIVDLSADFRFEHLPTYEKHYVKHGAPELIPQAVFGLPELYRERIRTAKLIGNPGCYPTSAILALYPLVKERLVDGAVFVDSKSGVSGAGREAKLGSLFCEVAEGFRPYNVGVHRHEPEIQKEVSKFADVTVAFVPHLLPINRGILTNVYGKLKSPAVTTKDLLELYNRAYQGEPFVRVMAEGVYPDTRFTRFSNRCDIGLKVFEDGRFVVISAIDNLVKGASGQAVQNMNVALGVDEKTALDSMALYP